ncbi:MAG: hypothetical protein U0T72_09790 [Chitinophagales bacterium]
MYKHYILSTALLLMSLFGNISSSSAQSGRVGIGESNPGSKGSIKGNLSVGTNYSSIAAPTNGAIIEGQVGIGASTPDASSALEISSNTKGILIPRMTTSERTSISSPATGLLVYDISLNQFWYFDGSSWVAAIVLKGDTGATGAAGATGTQGVKGDTGAAGLTGTQGVKGDTGAAGAQAHKELKATREQPELQAHRELKATREQPELQAHREQQDFYKTAPLPDKPLFGMALLG